MPQYQHLFFLFFLLFIFPSYERKYKPKTNVTNHIHTLSKYIVSIKIMALKYICSWNALNTSSHMSHTNIEIVTTIQITINKMLQHWIDKQNTVSHVYGMFRPECNENQWGENVNIIIPETFSSTIQTWTKRKCLFVSTQNALITNKIHIHKLISKCQSCWIDFHLCPSHINVKSWC